MLLTRQIERINISQVLYSRTFFLFTLFLIALLIRLIGTNATLIGDQIASLHEADQLGTNLQGLPYFALLKVFMAFSQNVVWLRLPSILLGSLAIPMCWLWLSHWRGNFVATSTSLLLALSPLAIEYSQQVRFYGLYLFAVILFFWIYIRILFDTKSLTRGWLASLVFASVLLISSHLLGVLIVFLAAVHWSIFNSTRIPRWMWITLTLGVGLTATVLFIGVLLPNVFESFYQTFMRVIASRLQDYSTPRGWSPIILAKAAILSFHFLFGQYVYFLDLYIVLPGMLLALLLGISGLVRLYREKPRYSFYLLFLVGLVGSILVLAVFEPLTPTNFIATTSARHLIWILPLTLWLLSEGLHSISHLSLRYVLLFMLLLIQGLSSLSFYTTSDKLAGSVEYLSALDTSSKDALIYADGRAKDLLQFYLNNSNNLRSLWNHMNTDEGSDFHPENYQRVAVMTLEEKENQRCQHSQFLAQMANFPIVYSEVQYPMFVYTFDTTSILSSNAPLLPQTVFHPRFQDLALPQQVNWGGYRAKIVGAYSLPDCGGNASWSYTFREPVAGKSILLFSNLFSNRSLEDGEVIAQLDVTTQQNTVISYPLRKGYETQTWDSHCISGCSSVLTWSKHVHLVGFSAYPGAYDDFEAHIWGVELTLPNENIQSLVIQMVHPDVELTLWGLTIFDVL